MRPSRSRNHFFFFHYLWSLQFLFYLFYLRWMPPSITVGMRFDNKDQYIIITQVKWVRCAAISARSATKPRPAGLFGARAFVNSTLSRSLSSSQPHPITLVNAGSHLPTLFQSLANLSSQATSQSTNFYYLTCNTKFTTGNITSNHLLELKPPD